eukprot:351382-Chlamydomonas_euryale.AAC.8
MRLAAHDARAGGSRCRTPTPTHTCDEGGIHTGHTVHTGSGRSGFPEADDGRGSERPAAAIRAKLEAEPATRASCAPVGRAGSGWFLG